MKKQTMIIDLDRCVGCFSCNVACKEFYHTPAGAAKIQVHKRGPEGTFPDLSMHYLPVMCQHCENPPCRDVCPTGATRQLDSGLVTVDPDICSGCGDCVDACPFGARYLSEERGVSESCDYCFDFRAPGALPICVKTCSSKALRFFDPEHPDEVTRAWLKQEETNTFTLESDAEAAKPRVKYILRRQPFKALRKA